MLVPVTAGLEVVQVADSSAAISATIGAAYLDDSISGALPDGSRFAIYVADPSADLPDNPRAAVLAARLGLDVDRAVMARLRGDVLITGLAPASDDDRDVPPAIVQLARRQ